MAQFAQLLSSIIPTFGIVGAGWLCRRVGIWGPGAVKVLNSYAYYIALPALIFQSLSVSGIGARLTRGPVLLIVGTLAAHALVFLVIRIATVTTRTSQEVKAVAPMILTFGSTAYLGLPFVANTFGPEAVPLASLVSVSLVVVTLFFSLATLRRYGRLPSERSFIREVIGLPFVYTVIAGLAVGFTGLALPGFIMKTVDVLAGSAGPTALLALGAFDYGLRRAQVNLKQAVALGAGKVFITGIVTFAILKLIGITGLPLAVGTAMGAVSVAVTAFVLADQYKMGRQLTDAAITVSGAAAFIALSAISYLWIATKVFA